MLALTARVVAAAGLVAVFAQLAGPFGRSVAALTVALLFAATSLLWYIVFEPDAAPALTFGLIAIFSALTYAWRERPPDAARGLLLGVLVGFAANLQRQEAVFLFLPIVVALVRERSVPKAVARLGWTLAAALPLMVLAFVRQGWPAMESLFTGDVRWSLVLFSSWHGLLAWTPVAYIAVAGTIFLVRRDAGWAIAALATLLLLAIVNGTSANWSGGPGFGGHHLTSALAVLAPGLAFVIDAARRAPLVAVAPLVVAALAWNYLLMVQYTIGLLPKDEPVSFAALVRQQTDALTRGTYAHPFSFPANAWFAWREGVPIDRYDLLAAEAPKPSLDLTFDRGVDRYLLEGWDAPGSDDWGPAWWLGGGRRTSLAVPLAIDAGRDVAVTVLARTRLEEPAVEAELAVEINGRDIGRLRAPATAPAEARFIVPASARVWRRGVNRITFVSLAVHRVDPADTRPPGPLASRPGNPAWPVSIYRLVIAPR